MREPHVRWCGRGSSGTNRFPLPPYADSTSTSVHAALKPLFHCSRIESTPAAEPGFVSWFVSVSSASGEPLNRASIVPTVSPRGPFRRGERGKS